MATPQDNISMALFCDFENVALGVRDANYEKFDIKRVLERLLLKGSIVVKKSYCDWDRYKSFKAAMHEANFELIEIPHVRQSGKNSADIRLVVDALDLCYTKSHVNTFVIISGDSDFSPLVSKLRENAKYVIGVGVKQSTSDLLIANCDEFIFYDDLVRESQRHRRDTRDSSQQAPTQRRSPEEEKRRREEMDARRAKIIDAAVQTYEALVTDRDDGGRIWASVLKEAIKRRNPGFNESYYGFKTFGNLLEEAQARGLLEFGRDEKSGAYVYRPAHATTRTEVPALSAGTESAAIAEAPEHRAPRHEDSARGTRRRGRRHAEQEWAQADLAEEAAHEADTELADDASYEVASDVPAAEVVNDTSEAGFGDLADETAWPDSLAAEAPSSRRSRERGGRRQSARKRAAEVKQLAAHAVEAAPMETTGRGAAEVGTGPTQEAPRAQDHAAPEARSRAGASRRHGRASGTVPADASDNASDNATNRATNRAAGAPPGTDTHVPSAPPEDRAGPEAEKPAAKSRRPRKTASKQSAKTAPKRKADGSPTSTE